MPTSSIHEVKRRVRITDINYGNHLGNDSLVSILHDARVDWLHHHQLSELNVDTASENTSSTGLIMSELVVNYLNESFYGDELIITLAVGDCTQAGFELLYKVDAFRNSQTIPVALAKTAMVCFDYQKRKVSSIPPKLLNLLGQ
jgi:acyl-CoA thioesterase FadM